MNTRLHVSDLHVSELRVSEIQVSDLSTSDPSVSDLAASDMSVSGVTVSDLPVSEPLALFSLGPSSVSFLFVFLLMLWSGPVISEPQLMAGEPAVPMVPETYSPDAPGAQKPVWQRDLGQMIRDWRTWYGPRTDSSSSESVQIPLRAAVAQGDLALVARLLDLGANVDGPGPGHDTPLQVAVWYGHRDMARLLLQRGANPNLASAGLGAPPLHLAVRKGDHAMLQLLLDLQVPIASPIPREAQPPQDRLGDSALHEAAEAGDASALQLLLNAGADPNTPNFNGLTPLYHAVAANHLDLVPLLLQRGADLNWQTRIGVTPVHWAIVNGQGQSLELLLQQGAEVNTRTRNGSTPLHTAVARHETDMVAVLLAHGANPALQGSTGETPLVLAQRLGASPIVDLLRAATTRSPASD